MSYVYHGFISYKSEDRAWAERLAKELAAVGLKVFWDKDPDKGLVAARPWEPQLREAIDGSSALIAVWSKRAAMMNTWNDRERFVFEQNELRSPIAKGRPVIYVKLDAAPSLSGMQDVTDLETYDSVEKVPNSVWETVAARVKRAIRPDGVTYVETLILAATREEMKPAELGAASWNQLAMHSKNIGLGGPIEERYGATRRDWKPHGKESVEDILKSLKQRAQDVPPGVTLVFEKTDEQIWSEDPNTADAAGRRLAGKLALILIDPLSLYVNRIQSRMPYLRRCMDSSKNAFAVLAPVPTDDEPLNAIAQIYIGNLYQNFFTPQPQPLVNAQVGMHLRNSQELLRVLLMAHLRGVETVEPATRKNAMTAMGGV